MEQVKTIEPGEYLVCGCDITSTGIEVNGSLEVDIPAGYTRAAVTAQAREALSVNPNIVGFVVLSRRNN